MIKCTTLLCGRDAAFDVNNGNYEHPEYKCSICYYRGQWDKLAVPHHRRPFAYAVHPRVNLVDKKEA